MQIVVQIPYVLRPGSCALGGCGLGVAPWGVLGGGGLERRATLDLEAAHVPRLGEEMLLVIAAPPGSTMPSGQPGCQRGSLTQSDVPTDAALMTVPFSVLEKLRKDRRVKAAFPVAVADAVGAYPVVGTAARVRAPPGAPLPPRAFPRCRVLLLN